MSVIRNGVDTELFVPKEELNPSLKQRLNLPPDTILLGTVSRWHAQKDIPNLLAALADLKQSQDLLWHCVLIGFNLTHKNSQLMDAIRRHGLTGLISAYGSETEELPAAFSSMDIHILPSSEEAFPNVLLEAMACGTPCIATDTGDSAFIVGDTGWVVPTSNHLALSKSIETALGERLSRSHAWRKRQKKARRRVIDNFSLQKMHSQYLAAWTGNTEPDEGLDTH